MKSEIVRTSEPSHEREDQVPVETGADVEILPQKISEFEFLQLVSVLDCQYWQMGVVDPENVQN